MHWPLRPGAAARGWKRARGLRAIPLALLFLAAFWGRAAATETDYSGSYELANTKVRRAFLLEVKQTATRAEVSFAATMGDGSGSAPEGAGKGRIRDGVLAFAFKDSFNNEGTCTLAPRKDGYHLDMVVTKVVDSRPFHFYGNVVLKKTSGTSPGTSP